MSTSAVLMAAGVGDSEATAMSAAVVSSACSFRYYVFIRMKTTDIVINTFF